MCDVFNLRGFINKGNKYCAPFPFFSELKIDKVKFARLLFKIILPSKINCVLLRRKKATDDSNDSQKYYSQKRTQA